MKTDTLWASVVGTSGITVSYLLGGLDKAVHALIILMLIDFVTGWLIGYKKKQVSSKTAYNGIRKKVVMVLMVIVGAQADYLTGNDGVFRNMIIWYLIGIECTSLIENAGKFGLAFPEGFKQRFTQLQQPQPAKDDNTVVNIEDAKKDDEVI